MGQANFSDDLMFYPEFFFPTELGFPRPVFGAKILLAVVSGFHVGGKSIHISTESNFSGF